MPRFRATRAVSAVPAAAVREHELTLSERRARAADRAWLLLGTTSIPTTDIVESYLDEILGTP
jgi:hypothetical protein